MSIYSTSSPKHCANQGFSLRLNKKLLWTIFSTLFSLLLAILLIYLILHPSKPHFHLKELTLYDLSLTSPRLLNSTIQFTLVSFNPNTRVAVYYDQFRAYASYKGQVITNQALIPPFYQDHEDTNLLSGILVGIGIPVSATFAYDVTRDRMAGRILIRIKVDGGLRWKVGSWVTGRYRIDVDCGVVVGIGQSALGPMQGTQCSTTV